jgi:hypothetical protein
MAYAISLAALRGMGLVGPGAADVARAILIELLMESALPIEVVMPHGLARRLLRDQDPDSVPGLVVLDSVRDVVTHVEVEIVRRSGSGRNLGRPKDLPWLVVMTSPGTTADTLRSAIEAGAEYLVLGVVLEQWPSGITCTVDAEGIVTSLSGQDAPAWLNHRLPTLTLDQALDSLSQRERIQRRNNS